MSRRLLPLAVLALAGLLTAGCAETSSFAARIGTTTISDADFQAELVEWVGNPEALGEDAPAPLAPGAFDGSVARGLLARRIDYELSNAEFEAQGLTLDASMREEVIAVVFGDQAEADLELEAFSDEYASALMDDLARQIAVATALGDDGYAAWRTEALASTDIEVNPRYGTWDDMTGAITALPAPLSGPAGT